MTKLKEFLNNHKYRILFFIVIFIFTLLFSLGYYEKKSNDTKEKFVFTAVGDFGDNGDLEKVLVGMEKVKPSFHYILGDLHQSARITEPEWCSLVKSFVGEIPFELTVGNHESGNGDPLLIENFVKCLPNKISTMKGTYGKEYYFDYPEEKPLMRIISIVPGIFFENNKIVSYALGSKNYNWLILAINEARLSGIPWITVSFHRNCINPSERACEAGAEIVNDLIKNQKVDLILNGNEHIYARSKSLLCIGGKGDVSIFEPSCLAENKLKNVYKQGEGTVLVVSGTGGQELKDVSADNSKANYFEKYMGANLNPSLGFSKIIVSPKELRFEFVPVKGDFRDSFVIKR